MRFQLSSGRLESWNQLRLREELSSTKLSLGGSKLESPPKNELLGVLHFSPYQVMQFIEITTDKGVLEVTGNHLVTRMVCEGQTRLELARKLQRGDLLVYHREG